MKNVQSMDCSGTTTTVRLERVNFFNRQLLTADDMTTERDYFLQKLRRHNRFMHGWGVVCGLPVTAAPISGTPWRVQIGSGYALGPYGDEIFVGDPVHFDLAACLTGGATNPCEPNMTASGGAGTQTVAYLAIKYAECLARPVQVASSGCGCDNDPCQYSRIRDSFQIQCLAQLPPQHTITTTLCQVVRGGVLAPCPPCPTDPWVVLAKINLPSSQNMNITNSSIDNVSVRRVILSTAVLQDQIVRCCCGPAPSSSSSSSAAAAQPPNLTFEGKRAVLNVGQRSTRLGSAGGVQVAVTMLNSGAHADDGVVLTVDLSPTLSASEYTLTAAEWASATLAQLKSHPLTLQPGKAHTLSFEIAPTKPTAAVSVTSKAAAVGAAPHVTGAASPLHIVVGTISSSSSSSAAASGALPAKPAAPAANITIGQQSTRVAGAPGAALIAVTMANNGPQPAEGVVVTVDLSPTLTADGYNLAAPGWESASFAQLKSAPVTVEPGKPQTLSFQITPLKKADAVTLTSTVSAAGATPAIAGSAAPLQTTIGG